MNNRYEQEIRYRLLQILSKEAGLSQRDMAQKAGISLGKVNYCLSELAKTGLIKIIRFKSAKNKKPYTYILTPGGLQEKARLTVRFLRLKLLEYEEIKRQIRKLASEVEPEQLNDEAENETLRELRWIS